MRARAISILRHWLAIGVAAGRARPRRVAAIAAAAVVGYAALSGASLPAQAQLAAEAASASTTPTSKPAGTSRTSRPTPTSTPTTAPTETGNTPTTTPTSKRATTAGALATGPTGPTRVATVASVTDGDTIRVILDGQNVPVRYIGIDTPEIHDGVAPFGAEATDANARLVAGRQVVLAKDVSETDRYGRLLRYVWLQNDAGWLLVNLELLRLGMAQVTTYPPDVKYVDELYLPAQRAAREAGVGLWADAPPAVATPVPFAPSACEASYPDFCVPIGADDLDCPDIDERRFRVLWNVPRPDPHRFDGDGDGIGCEG